MDIKEFGPVEEKVRTQMQNCLSAEDGATGVLCADNHLGYSMPIGGVVAYHGLVSPSAVGYDIACGNFAVKTDLLASEIDRGRVMDEIWKQLSFGVGLKNNERVEHPVLDEIAECDHPAQKPLAKLAADQLGTVGSGNHYVDLFEEDGTGALWIGVHFGSRGFGHKTATWALHSAGSHGDDMMALPTVIDANSDLGQLYIDGMQRAGRYAYAGREQVVARVARIIGAQIGSTVHNHHNFAWREDHGDGPVWVHRKGATPAFPGQRGFVGGTMGEPAVILEGVATDEAAAALYSTVHGAGRVMSRRQAAGKVKTTMKWVCRDYRKCDFQGAAGGFRRGPNGETPKCPNCGHKLDLRPVERVVTPGAVDYAAWRTKLGAEGIEIRGGGADEAPECYKRLTDVLAYHGDTIRILHVLRPIGVAMAGPEVVDPYKD